MDKLFEFFEGKKTYLIALGLASLAVAKYFVPELPVELLGLESTGDYSLAAGLIWAWRSTMKKSES